MDVRPTRFGIDIEAHLHPTILPPPVHRSKWRSGPAPALTRRERGLTQVELAERVGIAQPIVSDYERGELRLHGQLIVRLTEILGVTADELLGLAPASPARPVTHRRLVRRLQAIDRLPRRDQQALYRTIDAFLKSAASG
jgi:transcriptional regulator with XRE-family HTH domain